MNKYNEIEIQTAKNLLEKGFKWITRGTYGAILAYKIKPGYGNVICSDRVPIFESIRCGDEPVSLESIVYPQILDDDEKRYLKGVIRPFKDKVLYITKRSVISDSTIEYISIQLAGDEHIWLPRFKKGTMYKGMEPEHKYTLEELGL